MKRFFFKKYIMWFCLFSAFVCAIWAFLIEPNVLITNQQYIKADGINNLRIVFVADFHIKPNQRRRLANLVVMINEFNPDIVLSVGDFVSGHDQRQTLPIEEIAKELSLIKSKYGIYTTLGNHDWWQGGEEVKSVLERNGIVVLENENVKLNVGGKTLYIAGVGDLCTRTPDLKKALENTEFPTILLTHSPDFFPEVVDAPNSESKNVVLTLAGHTHGGQVILPIAGCKLT